MFKKTEHAIRDNWSFGITIMNPFDDYCDDHCLLHVEFFKNSIWYKIPKIFKPRKKWVDLTDRDWATPDKDGHKGYFNNIRRKYGFSMTNENIFIYYGIQPMCWIANDPKNSDHTKLYNWPWNETRRVRYDFYDLNGNYFCSANDNENGSVNFKSIEDARNMVPKVKFKFNDFDGEEIIAECYIEEMEWRYGTGLFKWLRYIRKPIIRRTLDLSFNQEIGYEKGSWKGGTIGHAIDLLPNEEPIEAFLRYGSADDRYKNHGTKNRGFSNVVQL